MSRNRLRLTHRALHLLRTRLQTKPSLTGYGNYVHGLKNFLVISCEEFQSVDEILVPFKDLSILIECTFQRNPKRGISSSAILLHPMVFYMSLMYNKGKKLALENLKKLFLLTTVLQIWLRQPNSRNVDFTTQVPFQQIVCTKHH